MRVWYVDSVNTEVVLCECDRSDILTALMFFSILRGRLNSTLWLWRMFSAFLVASARPLHFRIPSNTSSALLADSAEQWTARDKWVHSEVPRVIMWQLYLWAVPQLCQWESHPVTHSHFWLEAHSHVHKLQVKAKNCAVQWNGMICVWAHAVFSPAYLRHRGPLSLQCWFVFKVGLGGAKTFDVDTSPTENMPFPYAFKF